MVVTVATDDGDALVVGHAGLARGLARRFIGRGESLEDLQGVAQLALVAAARRFDPDRGAAFAAYASVCIVGELKRHLRDRAWAVRAPRRLHDLAMRIGQAREALTHQLGRPPRASDIAGYLGCSEKSILEAMEAASDLRFTSLETGTGPDSPAPIESLGGVDPNLGRSLDRLDLARALCVLDDDDRHVLEEYFFRGQTQAQIGRELGCSQMQVSRRLARALARLRDRMTVG